MAKKNTLQVKWILLTVVVLGAIAYETHETIVNMSSPLASSPYAPKTFFQFLLNMAGVQSLGSSSSSGGNRTGNPGTTAYQGTENYTNTRQNPGANADQGIGNLTPGSQGTNASKGENASGNKAGVNAGSNAENNSGNATGTNSDNSPANASQAGTGNNPSSNSDNTPQTNADQGTGNASGDNTPTNSDQGSGNTSGDNTQTNSDQGSGNNPDNSPGSGTDQGTGNLNSGGGSDGSSGGPSTCVQGCYPGCVPGCDSLCTPGCLLSNINPSNAPVINPVQSDSDAALSIAKQNQQNQQLAALIAQNQTLSAQVKESAAATKYQVINPNDIVPADSTPAPADIVQKIRSGELIQH